MNVRDVYFGSIGKQGDSGTLDLHPSPTSLQKEGACSNSLALLTADEAAEEGADATDDAPDATEEAPDVAPLATDETAEAAADDAAEAALEAWRTFRTGEALTAPMAASARIDLECIFLEVSEGLWYVPEARWMGGSREHSKQAQPL